MSYEGQMLIDLGMPSREEVELALLKTLFNHNGVIKEFATGVDIVDEIANEFALDENQRTTVLERIYRKENRIVKTPLWHRLLYRAADSLAKQKLVSNPKSTLALTNKREWMLTENGIDKALKTLKIPKEEKAFLPIKSYEVQKVVKKFNETPRPVNYNPIDKEKKVLKITREQTVRERGFRQAVIEAYDFKCAVCGMKMSSPNSSSWEVEAAHIVPNYKKGRDDIWNGISLCHLHHWGFDVGWFTLFDDYRIQVSKHADNVPKEFGKLGDYEFFKAMRENSLRIHLPSNKEIHPHPVAIKWHRENIFYP